MERLLLAGLWNHGGAGQQSAALAGGFLRSFFPPFLGLSRVGVRELTIAFVERLSLAFGLEISWQFRCEGLT